MSDEAPRDDTSDPAPAAADAADGSTPIPEHTEVHLAYAAASRLVASGDSAALALAGNLRRDPVLELDQLHV